MRWGNVFALGVIAQFLVLPVSAAPAEAGLPRNPNIRFSDAIDGDAVIGPVRAGMLCLPNGKLKWDDMRIPSDAAASAIIENALIQDGVFSTDVANTNRELRVSVDEIALHLCIPGIAGVGKSKGKGQISLRWIVSGRDNRSPQSFVTKIALTIDGTDPRRSSRLIETALVEGAHAFAAQWKAK
ncbi:MAG: hypothetical protein ABI395_01500 [Sphingobium sp.]